jgi:hypothetical protein
MPKKEPPQGVEPIRGGDTPSIVQGGYSGKIPTAAIAAFAWELVGLDYGMATLTFHIRNGKLARYTTGRERSFMGDGNGE